MLFLCDNEVHSEIRIVFFIVFQSQCQTMNVCMYLLYGKPSALIGSFSVRILQYAPWMKKTNILQASFIILKIWKLLM